jgi:galactose mutarotase-like enzyme
MRTDHAGYEAVVLEAGELRAAFLPELGLVGSSLTHAGEELLGRTDNLARYAAEGSTLGIPLLHPWANRLDGGRFDGVELDLGSLLLHLDANGLPIHGVVGPRLPWTVVEESATRLVGELELSSPELLAVLPFPHRLAQELELDGGGLTVTTTLTAAGDAAVPVSFGYHPYFLLPDGARVELPPMRRLELDGRSIPTGREEPYSGLAGPLDRDYDDGFAGLPAVPRFALEGGGRRIEVTFLGGFPYAQVFAPAGKGFICFEPMTAPTNALVSGAGLRQAPPGEPFSASFRIGVL